MSSGFSLSLALSLALGLLGGCTTEIEVLEPGPTPDPGTSPDPDPGTPQPPTTNQTAQLLAEWSGCMSLASFTSTNMAPAWSTMATSSQCANCHASGESGFVMWSDAATFFAAISEHSTMLLQFFSVDLSPPGKVIANPAPFHAIATGARPYAGHPSVTVPAAGLAALAAFYDATAARQAAGTCDPPRLNSY